jgi:hypothetical protein
MCCFSVAAPVGWVQRLFPPRVHVSKTNIFARMIEPGVQALAYGLDLAAKRDRAGHFIDFDSLAAHAPNQD